MILADRLMNIDVVRPGEDIQSRWLGRLANAGSGYGVTRYRDDNCVLRVAFIMCCHAEARSTMLLMLVYNATMGEKCKALYFDCRRCPRCSSVRRGLI